MKRTLVIMLKEPRPGRVKTRLGRFIGMTVAARWFHHQTTRLIRRVKDPRWTIVLAVSPDREGLRSRVWPPDLRRVPQGSGDLGDRMGRMMRQAAPGPVCVIGADIPGIDRSRIAQAFAALGAADIVFGPALDGGYWLIGVRNARSIPRTLFQSVRWSTPEALQDTLASVPGARIAFVETLRDVDGPDDLRMTLPGARAT